MKTGKRKTLGRIMLKGDNITLLQGLEVTPWENFTKYLSRMKCSTCVIGEKAVLDLLFALELVMCKNIVLQFSWFANPTLMWLIPDLYTRHCYNKLFLCTFLLDPVGSTLR